MEYWWVNQNQTASHEIAGGYMWSPKRNHNGSYSQFYENMHSVDAGDLVFSYYETKIQHLGIVRHPAISAPKPAEFGSVGQNWSDSGWYVPVEWHAVPKPFRPKDLIEVLRPLLPSKYSPLRDSGDGLQSVYLAWVPEPMARVLLNEIGKVGREIADVARNVGGDENSVSAIDNAVENGIRNNTEIDETEKQAVISARRGQGRFRQNLETIEQKCRVTGVTDQRLLMASHIKPWRACADNKERLDGYNGLLLTPHIDRLFDRGYISFTDDGEMLISPRMDTGQLGRLGVSTNPPSKVGGFRPEQQTYLAYHRDNVFLGSHAVSVAKAIRGATPKKRQVGERAG